jgi:hypothetical protein
VKRGATIPIKLKLCSASGVNASASTIVVTATHLTFESSSTARVADDAGRANADGNFRFDTSLGPGYIFNLKTTGLVKGTYLLHFTATGNPQPHVVPFQVQKGPPAMGRFGAVGSGHPNRSGCFRRSVTPQVMCCGRRSGQRRWRPRSWLVRKARSSMTEEPGWSSC